MILALNLHENVIGIDSDPEKLYYWDVLFDKHLQRLIGTKIYHIFKVAVMKPNSMSFAGSTRIKLWNNSF